MSPNHKPTYSLKKKHLVGGLLFFTPSMVNTLREEKQMKEFQITYNIWGTYSDGLLVGCGTIMAHDKNEALLRAT